jgi:hypothetical protein
MAAETNPFLLGLSIKDLDSNVRSEISYLDRNLTNGINTQTGNVIANTTAQGGLLRDQMNRSTDYMVSDAHRNTDALAGTVERQNIQGQTLSDMRYKDLKDVTMRGSDLGLNDGRRNADFALNDARRNNDFLSTSIDRNGMANLIATKDGRMDITSAVDRNGMSNLISTKDARMDVTTAVERNGVAGMLTTKDARMDITTAVERNGVSGMLATKDARMDITNSVDRNGTANSLATQSLRGEVLTSIEHSNVANNLNAYNLAKDVGSAVERNGVSGVLATERNGGILLNETIRGQGQVRDLINHQASEARNYLNQLSGQGYQLAKEAALSAKETDLKIAEATFKAQQQGTDFLVGLGNMKSSLERQAADNAALAARDMAFLTRDVLLSKGEIMKQSSDQTAAIQLEALKNKDALSCQIHHTYEKLSALNTDRIRDNLDDYRAEYTGLKYADHHNRHHIHNNLYSGVNRDRDFGRDGFGR